MGERYFVDTMIWKDYHENRKDRFMPLGEWAFAFLKKTIEEGDQIFVSDVVVRELKNNHSEQEIREIFSVVEKTQPLIKINVTTKQCGEASRISKERNIPFGDAVHAIVARDLGATVITRDHHFEELLDIVYSAKPEDLL